MSLWKKHLKTGWDPFDTYLVKICLHNIVGGKPASEDMIEKWVTATNKAKSNEERKRIIDAHLETVADITDEKTEQQTTVFSRVDGELVIEGRQVKAMIKEAANIIKTIGPDDIKNLRSKVADQVFVAEKYIVENAEIEFTVKKRKGRDKQSVPETTLLAILDYAQAVGLGADRSQGFGLFDVISVEKI
jgi:CRISPR/Cas system CSM-associated protein Csm4 (group 5 of RAMP superfamily)